jgi:hypothetical protein
MKKRFALICVASVALAAVAVSATAQAPRTVVVANQTDTCFVITTHYYQHGTGVPSEILIGRGPVDPHGSRTFAYTYAGKIPIAVTVRGEACNGSRVNIHAALVVEAYPREAFRIVRVGDHFEIDFAFGKH